jgi:hypothetical protein
MLNDLYRSGTKKLIFRIYRLKNQFLELRENSRGSKILKKLNIIPIAIESLVSFSFTISIRKKVKQFLKNPNIIDRKMVKKLVLCHLLPPIHLNLENHLNPDC